MMQLLVAPRPQQVAWISVPDYTGNAFHLYRHMLANRSGIDHVWLVVDPASRQRIEADLRRYERTGGVDSAVRVLDRHSWRGYWAWLRSGCTFHTHGSYAMNRSAHRRRIVSLWHGMPIKVIGALNTLTPNPRPNFGTLHVATSAMYRCVIAAAFRASIDDVVVAGLPRSDVLTRPSPLAPDAEQVRSSLGIPPTHRLVVWMPTYRSEGAHASSATPHSFIDDIADDRWRRIGELAARHHTTVLVKLHPFDPANRTVRQPRSANIRVINSDDFLLAGIELYDLLAESDGIISDVSSVMIDYIVTDRPIGIIGFDPSTYHRDVVFPVRALQQSARIHDLRDDEALVDFFERAGGAVAEAVHDDLSIWLNDAPLGQGCEAVLAAVEL